MSNEITTSDPLILAGNVSPALQILLNDRLFERAKLLAKYLAGAEGFVPRHLIGKTEACFAVVCRAITWKLDPFAVAASTYQTPGGSVGYEGKLIIAILENSGKLAGGVRFEHYGDWSKVQNRFEIRKSDKGKDYAVPSWTDKDAAGLGVIVRAQVDGEVEPREHRFDLIQAQPRNSTLWATDPKTQICYTAARRFANVACPGVIMGVPFDREDEGAPALRDVTPAARPLVSDFVLHDEDGVIDEDAERKRVASIVNQHKQQLGEAIDDDETEPPGASSPPGAAPAGNSQPNAPAGAPPFDLTDDISTRGWLGRVSDAFRAAGSDRVEIKRRLDEYAAGLRAIADGSKNADCSAQAKTLIAHAQRFGGVG